MLDAKDSCPPSSPTAPSPRLAGELLGRDLQHLTGLPSTPDDDAGRLPATLHRDRDRRFHAGTPDGGRDEGRPRAARRPDRTLYPGLRPGQTAATSCWWPAPTAAAPSTAWWTHARTGRLGVGMVGRRDAAAGARTSRRRRLPPLGGAFGAWRGIFINDEDWGLQPWAAQDLTSRRGTSARRPMRACSSCCGA